MSADLLREAAALMRERAEAVDAEDYSRRIVAKTGRRTPAGQHIASWHPEAALAAAELLEVLATMPSASDQTDIAAAKRFARIYLGRTA